jgi:hypothetical protein
MSKFCKTIGTYWTDLQPSHGLGMNKGRPTAIGYSESGKGLILSFPAHLNSRKIPELREVAGILRGDTVAAAMTEFNRANVRRLADKMNAEKLDWLEYPACDEMILRADVGGIFIVDAVTYEHIERVADCWIDAGPERVEPVSVNAPAKADDDERDPMPGDRCDTCGVQLESSQTGVCEDCAPAKRGQE